MQNSYDTIIIGAGAGGLACAVCLAREGQKVLLLEQHDVPGGWCHSFTLKGQRFSPGVHYVGLAGEGDGTNELYCGLGVANDIVFFRMNEEGFEHCVLDDYEFDIPAGTEQFKKKLSEHFPKEKKQIHKYLDLVKKVNYEIQLVPKLKGFLQHLTVPFRTRHMGKYALFSLKRVIGWYIKDPKLKTILNIQCGDHGLPPKKASFLVHCVLMGHYLDGGYYPYGGGGGLVKAFTKRIKHLGGEIKTQAKVSKIVIEDKKAVGVKLTDGTFFSAKNIVSNADPGITFNEMVGKDQISDRLAKRIENIKYSLSSLILFLTLDMDVTKHGIDSGNYWVFKEGDIDTAYDKMSDRKFMDEDEFGGVFISCTTLKDPPSFNGRYHNFEIVTFLDYSIFEQFDKEDYHDEAYADFKNKLKEKLLNTVERLIPGAKENIIQAELGTPMTNKFYVNSSKGNVYGTEKTLKGVGPFAFRAKTEIDQLYLTGASTLSHGVGGAMNSGIQTAAAIVGKRPEEMLIEDENQHLRIYNAEHPEEWPDWVIQKRKDKERRFKDVS